MQIIYNYEYPSVEERRMQEGRRAGKHWAYPEEHFLLDNFLNLKDTYSIKEICIALAFEHKRTPFAILCKLASLHVITKQEYKQQRLLIHG